MAKALPNNPLGTATHFTDIGDTCVSIVDKYQNFTAPDLYRWNPYVHPRLTHPTLLIHNPSSIGTSCFNLIAGDRICINVPGYTYPGPIKAGDIFTLEQLPVPRLPNIVSSCTKFEYTDAEGKPGFASILATNGITLRQWRVWNWPERDPDQDSAIWASHFSCVAA